MIKVNCLAGISDLGFVEFGSRIEEKVTSLFITTTAESRQLFLQKSPS